jgi:hypothetical protein
VSGPTPENPAALALGTTQQGLQQLRVPAVADGDGTFLAEVTTTVPGTYQVWLVDDAAGLTPTTGTPAVLVVTDGT